MEEANKVESLTERRLPPNAGKGRPKGSKNKTTKALKDMILGALDESHEDGGIGYLKKQAEEQPVAFMTLIGKVLPTTLAGDPDNPVFTVSDDMLDERLMALIAQAEKDNG